MRLNPFKRIAELEVMVEELRAHTHCLGHKNTTVTEPPQYGVQSGSYAPTWHEERIKKLEAAVAAR